VQPGYQTHLKFSISIHASIVDARKGLAAALRGIEISNKLHLSLNKKLVSVLELV
jgi:hypothetical protein